MSKTGSRPSPARPGSPGSEKKPSQPRYGGRSLSLLFIALALGAIVIFAVTRGGPDTAGGSGSKPAVGADLHSLVVDPEDPDRIYVGGHQGVSVSSDGGKMWKTVSSLDGADAMGWAFTDTAILVGGHPGISVSTDGGNAFEPRNDGLPSTDVHALGAEGNVVYAGIAGLGTFASTDGGITWEKRSQEVGGAFMGRILVDPNDADHLLAPDMQFGVMESTDGGRSWDALGGIPGAMWVSWDPDDTDSIIATAMGQAVKSTDGGLTWDVLDVPEGTSIIEFGSRDAELLAAVLETPEATIYVSKDGGGSWTQP